MSVEKSEIEMKSPLIIPLKSTSSELFKVRNYKSDNKYLPDIVINESHFASPSSSHKSFLFMTKTQMILDSSFDNVLEHLVYYIFRALSMLMDDL